MFEKQQEKMKNQVQALAHAELIPFSYVDNTKNKADVKLNKTKTMSLLVKSDLRNEQYILCIGNLLHIMKR